MLQEAQALLAMNTLPGWHQHKSQTKHPLSGFPGHLAGKETQASHSRSCWPGPALQGQRDSPHQEGGSRGPLRLGPDGTLMLALSTSHQSGRSTPSSWTLGRTQLHTHTHHPEIIFLNMNRRF